MYMYMYSVESNDGEGPAGHKYHHTVQHLFSITYTILCTCMYMYMCTYMYIHVHVHGVVKEVASFRGLISGTCTLYMYMYVKEYTLELYRPAGRKLLVHTCSIIEIHVLYVHVQCTYIVYLLLSFN